MKPTDDLRTWAAAYREAGQPPAALRGRILAALGEGDRAPRRSWRETIAYAGVGAIAAIAALVVLAWAARSMSAVDERKGEPNAAPYQQRADAPRPAPSRALPEPAELAPTITPAPIEPPSVAAPSRPSIERAADPTPPGVTDAPTDLESLRLLRAAERLLRDDPARARELLEDHARTYPTSALGIEREALWIRAACRAGGESSLAARRERFAERAGIGAYLAAIEKDCGDR